MLTCVTTRAILLATHTPAAAGTRQTPSHNAQARLVRLKYENGTVTSRRPWSLHDYGWCGSYMVWGSANQSVELYYVSRQNARVQSGGVLCDSLERRKGIVSQRDLRLACGAEDAHLETNAMGEVAAAA